ncbi:hypothetical protein LTS18_008065, partial [Coniosporium uncinatum]
METTIQFADSPLKPTKSNGAQSTGTSAAGGVFPLRSGPSIHRRRSSVVEMRRVKSIDDSEDEDPGLRDKRDYKHKQSLFMMVTLKYVFIVLHADNEGEGGTFSTYALLSRF